MTHPDIAFQKIRSGKSLAKRLVEEVSSWESSDDTDKLNAWCLLFLNKEGYFEKVVTKLSVILSSANVKAMTNALLVLMYAPNEMLISTRIKKATKFAFLNGDASVRVNATRILAAQKDLGDATAKKLLKQAANDPDPHVRKRGQASFSTY